MVVGTTVKMMGFDLENNKVNSNQFTSEELKEIYDLFMVNNVK